MILEARKSSEYKKNCEKRKKKEEKERKFRKKERKEKERKRKKNKRNKVVIQGKKSVLKNPGHL